MVITTARLSILKRQELAGAQGRRVHVDARLLEQRFATAVNTLELQKTSPETLRRLSSRQKVAKEPERMVHGVSY